MEKATQCGGSVTTITLHLMVNEHRGNVGRDDSSCFAEVNRLKNGRN
ncbi:hypothetical protein CISIN_1g041451mg [Citrus sinensis]|uniref:Uncharacterized protein n=1 Tax=Citrus sinensis TaxID=2711 RepID=A0A067D7D4_CITSI|nr:hypothetical protein CISIN_1g041451mg [Citrus sinensis]